MPPPTPLLDPPKASPFALAPASLLVLELIKTLSRLRFASLKAGSCPRHCPEKSGAQLFPRTPSFPLPWRRQAHRCTRGLLSPLEGTHPMHQASDPDTEQPLPSQQGLAGVHGLHRLPPKHPQITHPGSRSCTVAMQAQLQDNSDMPTPPKLLEHLPPESRKRKRWSRVLRWPIESQA